MSHPLATFRFPPNSCIPQALPQSAERVTRESPALHVMTDLTQVRAATIAPTDTIAQAEHEMLHQGVRLLFVVSQMPCIDGIITLTDLRGDRPTRVVHERHIRRDEVTVAEVMTPLPDLDAVDFASLRRATVDDVVATLQAFGRQHLVVVEDATPSTPPRIRGIISKTQVERQLGETIGGVEVARNFAEVERALL
jgi:CBS domain-containing protein